MEALSSYKMITTNTGAKSSQEAIKLAQVILLGEAHETKSEAKNDRLVNHMFQESDVLLVEGAMSLAESRSFKKSVLASTKSWDVPDSAKYERDYDLLNGLVKKTAVIFSLYKRFLFEKAGKKEFEELVQTIQRIRPFRATWNEKDPVKSLDQLLPFWLEVCKKIRKDVVSHIDQTFFERNQSMIKNILAYTGKGRVFVTTGWSHIRYDTPSSFKAVDEVYTGLQKSQIPYVALLTRRKKQPTKREIAGTLHSKEEALKKHSAWLKQSEDGLKEYKEGLESDLARCTKQGKFKVFDRYVRKIMELPAVERGVPNSVALGLSDLEILISQLMQVMDDYRHPVKDLGTLLKPYKIIHTNLEGRILGQVQVFLLGEREGSESGRINDRLINALYRKGDFVLTTLDPKAILKNNWRELNPGILSLAKRWDITVGEEKKYVEIAYGLTQYALYLAAGYELISSNEKEARTHSKALHDFGVEALQEVRPFKMAWNENKFLQCTHELMRVWLKGAAAFDNRAYSLFVKNFRVRRHLIIKSILAHKNKGKVFALLPLHYLKYEDPDDFKDVDKLYRGLKGVRYAALQPRKRGVVKTKREQTGTLHSKEAARKKFSLREKRYQEQDQSEHFDTILMERGKKPWLKEIKESATDALEELDTGPHTLDRMIGALTQAKFLIGQLQKARPLQSKL